MDISLSKLNYTFSRKPLLVGGKAMEYYGIRKAGADIDLVADEKDVVELIKRFPDRVKDLWGDLGVCPLDFEIWRTICFLGYDDLKDGAVDIGGVLVISEEKLLFMKALGMKKEKLLHDTKMIVEDIIKRKYEHYEEEVSHNKSLLQGITNISYIEKKS